MPQKQTPLHRHRLSSKRSFKCSDETDDRGWTMLHVVSRKGDLKENCSKEGSFIFKGKRLLDEGMDANVPAWGPKSHGVTPLHLAAQSGHLKVMDVLLEHGANIDARTKGACGWTPLHSAAKERKKGAIKFLVENGAFLPDDINDNRFNPPLHYCPCLEWAYEVKQRLQEEILSIGESSDSFES